jgi:hypothetical protein
MKNGTSYFVATEKLSYLDAALKCLSLGLNLVSIETNEKLGLIATISSGNIWCHNCQTLNMTPKSTFLRRDVDERRRLLLQFHSNVDLVRHKYQRFTASVDEY